MELVLLAFLRFDGLDGLVELDCVVGFVGQGGLAWLIRRFSIIESHDVHKIIEIVVLPSDSQHTDFSRNS